MIIRNSLLSLWRTKGKTLLFFAAIALLTVFMGLGASVWMNTEQLLRECDSSYVSVGLVEYMGPDYPDTDVAEPQAAAQREKLQELAEGNCPGVIQWVGGDAGLALAQGAKRIEKGIPYPNNSVVIIKDVYPGKLEEYAREGEKWYFATVEKVLYSRSGEEDTYLYFHLEDESFQPEDGHSYLLQGEWYSVSSQVELGAFTGNAEEELRSAPVWEDVTGKVDQVCGDDKNAYHRIAQFYRTANEALTVQETTALEFLPAFHQGQLFVTEGRAFTEEEYREGAKSCVISGRMAGILGLAVGDELPLALIPVDQENVYASFRTDREYSREPYKIVGITNESDEFTDDIFIPDQKDFTSNYGYTVGLVQLENARAEEFEQWLSAQAEDRVRISIFDQGYQKAARSLDLMRQAAAGITVVCAIASLVILAMFGYLFVYKQSAAIKIMNQLGTPKKKINLYLAAGCGTIAASAAAAGAAAGYFSGQTLLMNLEKLLRSSGKMQLDTRYSLTALGIEKAFGGTPEISGLWFLLAGLGMCLLAVASCSIFAVRVYKNPQKKKKQGRRKGETPAKQARSFGGSGRAAGFAWLSVKRGGIRTLVVPAVTLVLALFISVLASSWEKNQQQMEALSEQTEIKGNFVSINGRRIDSLAVPEEILHKMEESGLFQDITASMSREIHYLYLGEVGPGLPEPEPLPVPVSSFDYERRQREMMKWPYMVLTNSWAATKEFFYSGSPEVSWLDGYDESFFTMSREELEGTAEGIPCIAPLGMMEEKGLENGDVIGVGAYNGSWLVNMKIVGSYRGGGQNENLFLPLQSPLEVNEKRTYDTVRFVLKEPGKLGEAKNFLEESQICQVNNYSGIRKAVVLEDIDYQKSAIQLSERIGYLKMIFPVLLVLAGGISFVLSYLMVLGRKRELALMRSMGSGVWRTFASFFLEQAGLCLSGGILLLLIWGIFSQVSVFQALSVAGVLGCYLLGAALSVALLNRAGLVEILQDKE